MTFRNFLAACVSVATLTMATPAFAQSSYLDPYSALMQRQSSLERSLAGKKTALDQLNNKIIAMRFAAMNKINELPLTMRGQSNAAITAAANAIQLASARDIMAAQAKVVTATNALYASKLQYADALIQLKREAQKLTASAQVKQAAVYAAKVANGSIGAMTPGLNTSFVSPAFSLGTSSTGTLGRR